MKNKEIAGLAFGTIVLAAIILVIGFAKYQPPLYPIYDKDGWKEVMNEAIEKNDVSICNRLPENASYLHYYEEYPEETYPVYVTPRSYCIDGFSLR